MITKRIQHRTSTSFDRYPKKFTELAARLPGEARRVLSFGCARGLETATLNDIYFTKPGDRIVGVDISGYSINRAKLENARSRVSYYVGTDEAFGLEPDFDAIVAMSVLCIWPGTEQSETAHRNFLFDSFCTTISQLDARLKPGGLLCVYNANFRVMDTPLAGAYRPEQTGADAPGYVATFGPDNRRVRPCEHFLFRKPR